MFFKLLFIPKNYFPLVFLLLFSLGIFSDIQAKLLPPQTNTAVISGELKEWHKVTLSFQGPSTNENAVTNPFMDYRLNVIFTHPDTAYEIPGFYAGDGNAAETSASGGSTWQVHFAPDRPGNWTYSISFRTGNEVAISDLQSAGTSTHFDGETGSFYISPTDKVQPDLRASGRVSYIGKRYRQHQGNGEYFLRGGTDSPENLLIMTILIIPQIKMGYGKVILLTYKIGSKEILLGRRQKEKD